MSTGVENLAPHEAIPAVIRDWLAHEIQSSGQGRNAVLDNFYVAQRSLRMYADDSRNQSAKKNESHYNRLNMWAPQFFSESENDFVTARQLFCFQMYLSGMFRLGCIAAANSTEQYRQLRFSDEVLNIDIATRVESRLEHRFAKAKPTLLDLALGSIALNDLIETTYGANELIHDTMRNLHSQNRKPGSLFDYVRFRNSGRYEWFAKAVDLQRECLDVVTDYILYAAQIRGGDLGAVPMLEPTSISDNPQVRYPFRGEPLFKTL